MSGYGYTIIFSSSKYDKTCDKKIVTQLVNKQSPEIQEINGVLRKQFENPRYDCHLDHVMLFSIKFMNMNTRIYYDGLYVISVGEINHPLFITNEKLDKLLESNHKTQANDIYCTYPSFRFNKFHINDFFHLDDSNEIVIQKNQTNSHGLVRSY